MKLQELRAERARILDQMRALIDGAEKENRDLNAQEDTQYNDRKSKAEDYQKRTERQQNLPVPDEHTAPNINKLPLGDDVVKAMAHYLRTGDTGGVRPMLNSDEAEKNQGRPEVEVRIPGPYEKRATDEIMNVAAAADGGAAVPTGFVNQIAARRAEVALMDRLGCQLVTGRGTTGSYAYENADAVVFATTSEQIDALTNV